MEEHIHHMSDDLLVKHLTGEATEQEAAEVERWLQQSEDNSRYYEGFIQIWEQSLQQLANNTVVDENAAWQTFKQRANSRAQTIAPVRKLPVSKSILRIAAAVILIVASGIIGYTITGIFTATTVTQLAVQTTDNVLADTLADGSVVTINKRSGISYPSLFKKNTREITLKGEAFFNVAPNKKKPFIIHVNDVTITVVGTSFNVRTVNGKTEVIVETGIVKVSNGKQTVQLRPKEKVLADSMVIYTKDTTADKLYSYYRSKEFVCDNTPLKRLVEILNEAYGSHISIENKALENLPITTVFKEEPLDHIMTVIAETLSITAEKKAGEYILR